MTLYKSVVPSFIANRSRRTLLMILGLIVIIDGFVFGVYYLQKNKMEKKQTNNTVAMKQGTKRVTQELTPQEVRWLDDIKTKGSKAAYEQFKKEFQDEQAAHNSLHTFGRLLYEETGIDAVTICDRSFAFGCYHGVFQGALLSRGITILHQLDRACIRAYGETEIGCQHGIGHGILDYVGHNKLLIALQVCSELSWKGKIYGCTSGVFMEYNFPMLTGVRPLDTSSPYEPCVNIPDQFKDSCYYEQVQWWEKVFNQDYKQLGQLCNRIVEEENKIFCFLGMGSVVAQASNHQVDRAIATCKEIPTKDGEMYCRVGAGWNFSAQPEGTYRGISDSLCQGQSEKDTKHCLEIKYSDVILPL